jgi:hypothetical protein
VAWDDYSDEMTDEEFEKWWDDLENESLTVSETDEKFNDRIDQIMEM